MCSRQGKRGEDSGFMRLHGWRLEQEILKAWNRAALIMRLAFADRRLRRVVR